jgi:hypothetical protein
MNRESTDVLVMGWRPEGFVLSAGETGSFEQVIHEQKHSYTIQDAPVYATSVPPAEIVMFDYTDLKKFRDTILKLGDVIVAIMAEEEEQGERHVTTFIAEDSEEAVGQIADIEAGIILEFPEHNYSFHVRVLPRDEAGDPLLPTGNYFLLSWRKK